MRKELGEDFPYWVATPLDSIRLRSLSASLASKKTDVSTTTITKEELNEDFSYWVVTPLDPIVRQ